MASNGSESPLIGLTTYAEQARHGPWDEPAALLPLDYVAAVVAAGGTPVLLPPCPPDRVAVLDALAAVVVTGGPDVDPACYGGERHPETDAPRSERDRWEVALCAEAVARDLPLLGICRGLQVLNVAQGGSLHQHLPEVTGSDAHRPVRGEWATTDVEVEPGTILASVVGGATRGNCHHHQAVARLGEGLVVTARAADGTVEAAEVVGCRFALGVQWHPESDPGDGRLIAALVQAATGRRGAVA